MPDDDDTKNAVKDKFAQWFETEDTDGDGSDDSGDEENAQHAKSEKNEQRGKQSKSTLTPISIRDQWPNHSFYLRDELLGDLGSQFKKLDWQLSDEYGLDVKKTRHFYPLIAQLGLEQLKEMDNNDIKARTEDIEPEDDYFD